MEAFAIILHEPRSIGIGSVGLSEPVPGDVVVEVEHTGISAGTERLLWDGRMPSFPGMGYPLVPGYETIGRVVDARPGASLGVGDTVFVPGARCFRDVRPLFGGAASLLVTPADRVHRVDSTAPDQVLFALAATAHHAIAVGGAPELVLGHGVLGRLIARITIALGHAAPTVHEIRESRFGAEPYRVLHPDADTHRAYTNIMDASGRDDVIDASVARLGRGGTVTLAGFYSARLSFAFPAAFMKEARIAIATEFVADDVVAVRRLLDAGALSLDGLISHSAAVADAASAYATAFTDPDCLKMVLNWRSNS